MERTDINTWSAAEVARLLTLVENEKRYYQEILLLCPVPMAVAGEDLTLHAVNRAFRGLFHVQQGDLAASKLTDLFPALVIEDRVSRVLRTGVAEWRSELTIWDSEGQGRPCRLSVAPLPNAYSDRVMEVLVVAEEPDLAQSPAAHLLESLGAVAWMMNAATGELLFANTAEGLPGSPKEWMQRVWKEDQARVDWVYEAVLESGQAAAVDYRTGSNGDHLTWLSDVISPVVTEGRVTSLRILTMRLEERRRRLETFVQHREEEASMRLAQHVAHQFNNLWMIVTGYTEVLRETLPGGETDARDALLEIDRAARRGATATQQLLQFSRPPASPPVATDLQELVTRLDFNADYHFLPGEVVVLVDAARFREALSALVEDAYSSVAEGQRLQITITRRMVLSDFGDGLSRGNFANVRIGPLANVSALRQAHWREPFFSETERSGGIGLAPISSQLRQMGVSISLERDDKGHSAFVLQIPLVRHSEPRPAGGREAEGVKGADTAQGSVLVVDDNESVRNLISRFLSKEGYRVLTAGDAEEATSVFERSLQTIDVVVCDVMLPGPSGPELVANLRKEHPRLRVLFISGYTGGEALEQLQLGEGDEFLQKPFSLGALGELVKTVLLGVRD